MTWYWIHQANHDTRYLLIFLIAAFRIGLLMGSYLIAILYPLFFFRNIITAQILYTARPSFIIQSWERGVNCNRSVSWIPIKLFITEQNNIRLVVSICCWRRSTSLTPIILQGNTGLFGGHPLGFCTRYKSIFFLSLSFSDIRTVYIYERWI